MKKAILFMSIMMTLGASYSIAQSNNLIAANDLDLDGLNLYKLDNVDYSKSYSSKKYEIPENSSVFQMKSAFNELSINVKSEITYTTAELLSKTDNSTVYDMQINGNKESIDLSQTKPGTYYMILSNEDGDVLSEKITIL